MPHIDKKDWFRSSKKPSHSKHAENKMSVYIPPEVRARLQNIAKTSDMFQNRSHVIQYVLLRGVRAIEEEMASKESGNGEG